MEAGAAAGGGRVVEGGEPPRVGRRRHLRRTDRSLVELLTSESDIFSSVRGAGAPGGGPWWCCWW